jgi:hypothetical protein
MRRWLLSRGKLDWKLLGVKYSKIESVRKRGVTFTEKGKRYYFTTAEIKQFLGNVCRCEEYKRRIAVLEASTQASEAPVDVLIRRYIKDNFVRTTKRLCSRKFLRRKLDNYLEQYGLCVIDRDWKKLLEYLKEYSKQYRKLKLKIKR